MPAASAPSTSARVKRNGAPRTTAVPEGFSRKALQQPGGRVEADDAIAGLHGRFGNRHTVAASNLEKACAYGERGGKR